MSYDKADTKAVVRSWLYALLAELEIAPEVEGNRTESNGREVTIKLQFKN